MDPPECPVCLQPFSCDTTIPRVLSCGHSTCEVCLSSLPSPFPSSLRCPSCTQLVPLSPAPKNFDLLRLLPSLPTVPTTKPQPQPLPVPSTHSLWSPFILPPSAASRTRNLSRSPRVYPLTSSSPPPATHDSQFRPSYSHRISRELDRIAPTHRHALRRILRTARRGVSKVLGLWMSEEDSVVHLVVEEVAVELKDAVSCRGGGVVGLAVLMAEICEAVMGLNGGGVVCGCLGMECFGLDECGHCVSASVLISVSSMI